MDTIKMKRNDKSAINDSENVKVVVRCRPLSDREISLSDFPVVDVLPRTGIIQVTQPKNNAKENRKMYTYDTVYGWDSTQQNLYDETVKPLVASVLAGYNGCIFAYGQTGAGKTYTMEGSFDEPDQEGIIPKVFEQIWTHISQSENSQFLVSIRYIEIYMEEIRDLLKQRPKALHLRESKGKGVYVSNLRTINCTSLKDMHRAMRIGKKNRTVSSTNINTHSSRSHAIFQIVIEMGTNATNTVHAGKLNLIDLAGSERQSKTGACDERLKEACKINLALSSLGNVISALSENSHHIPYRDSKLTRLLQDSLGGNSKTIMIANIGPASSNYEETTTTLRYASRAKKITNKPIMNENPEDAKLREYQEEIEKLKRLIAEREMQINENKVTVEKESESETDMSEIESDGSCERSIIRKQVKMVQILEAQKFSNMKFENKLKKLEERLIKGGQNEESTEQQLEIEGIINEAADKEGEEQQIQMKLKLEKEENLDLQKTYNTIQEEIDFKDVILKKCNSRWQKLNEEINTLKEEHVEEMEKLQYTKENITTQQKLQNLIIDNLIDSKSKETILTSSKYDEENETWILGNRKRYDRDDFKFPKVRNYKLYKRENVLDLKQYEPVKSTISYTGPLIPPKYRNVVEACFNYEIENNKIQVMEAPPSFQAKDFDTAALERRFEASMLEMIRLPNDERQTVEYYAQRNASKQPSSRPKTHTSVFRK